MISSGRPTAIVDSPHADAESRRKEFASVEFPALWRKKRWVACAATCAAVVAAYIYSLSAGLGMYAVGRGWITRATFDAVYAPSLAVHRALGPRPGDENPGPLRLWFGAYEEDFLPHWYDLGRNAAGR